MVTKGDDGVERFVGELIYGFGLLVRDVDPDLHHHTNSKGMDIRREHPGTPDDPPLPAQCLHESFRHLTPDGVTGADKENLFRFSHHLPFLGGG